MIDAVGGAMGSLTTAARQTIDAATLAELRQQVQPAAAGARPTLIGLAPPLAQKKAAVELKPLLRRIQLRPGCTAW